MMKKIVTIASMAALAVGTLVTVPRPAHAIWWIAPAIVGTAIAGVGTGAVIADADRHYAYEPDRGTVYVAPTGCHFERALVDGVWRQVRVCD